jgi:hypothetical protein
LMQDPASQGDGWQSGSGMVESVRTLVVHARLKGAGMHWIPAHVNPMLALHSAPCRERWKEAWQEGGAEGQMQRQSQRTLQASGRLQAQLSSLLLLLVRCRLLPSPPAPPTSPAPRPTEPAATLPGSFRPSAHHPWKRRPACRPTSLATI